MSKTVVSLLLALSSAHLMLAPAGEAAPAEAGVLWRGADPSLALRDIATLVAPILWYSRDEPLLAEGFSIPGAHPCDVSSATPIVYYQVVELKLRGGERVGRPEEGDPRFFEKVESFILKYFFYYREDSGVGGHPHDLEAAEFEVFLDRVGAEYQVRLGSVTALAHGSRWYANILHIEPDTAFPVTLLVEEGKHATAPDRNGDGHYTPGYDVNRRVNDAWGVRDTLGSGVLLTAAYAAAMTKPRELQDRLLPPQTPLLQVSGRRASRRSADEHLGRYELRAGNAVARCETVPVEPERLDSMMTYHGFGEDQEPVQYGNNLRAALRQLRQPGGSWVPSISLRHERKLGLSLVFLGRDVGVGWVAAKLNTSGDSSASLGVLFTPSASRFADYYVAGGLNRVFKTSTLDVPIETPDGRVDVTFAVPPRWDLYLEAGIKFRAQLSGRARWFVLGHNFGGARIGIRTLGTSNFFDTRFVFEVGAGAW